MQIPLSQVTARFHCNYKVSKIDIFENGMICSLNDLQIESRPLQAKWVGPKHSATHVYIKIVYVMREKITYIPKKQQKNSNLYELSYQFMS